MKIGELNKIFYGKNNNGFVQFIRYFFVGAFAFIVDFSLLWLFTEKLKLFYLFSAAVSFFVGLCVNYFISVKWVFTERGLNNKKVEFLIFAVIGIVGLLFNELFIWLFTAIFGVYYLTSKFLTTILVYFWNFFARKYILYGK